jgi:hypothetical protein
MSRHQDKRVSPGSRARKVHVPDHKTRLATVALDLAYREAKPVERAQVLHADADDFPSLIDRLKQSPLSWR